MAYSVWAACGVALVATIRAAFLRESLTWVQVAGLGMVIGGVVALQAGSGVH